MIKPYKTVIHTLSLTLLLMFYQMSTMAGSINPNEVNAYKNINKQPNDPNDSVVFIGSSSIKRWYTLAQDISPINVIQRGFNAAKLTDINNLL